MTFKVIADAEAKLEWNEAVDRYEERETGVGLRFDDALRTFLQTLAQDPERFRRATALTRKAKMPEPWPYSIYFTWRHRRAVKPLSKVRTDTGSG